MSAPKFTPGPYIFNGVHIYGGTDPRSKHANGRVLLGGVCDAFDSFGVPTTPKEPEAVAVGHLWAAAPDLYATGREAYEALHDIINAAQGDDPYSAEELDNLFSDIAGKLFEALRKAEGAT